MSHRVVITGTGCVTPLGHDVESVWKKLLAGESGITRITRFDASSFPSDFAGFVPSDGPEAFVVNDFVRDTQLHAHAGLSTRFALGAAVQAWRQSGLANDEKLDPRRVGVYLGSGEGTLDFDNLVASNLAGWDAGVEKSLGCVDTEAWLQHARERLSPWRELEQEADMTLAHVAAEVDAHGPAANCLTACAASTQAIGQAMEVLRRGDADVMLAGGAHTMIHPFGLTGFNRLTALSTRKDEIETSSRPFDQTRDGFVLGEGAGIVVLETLEHAVQRGAVERGCVLGELIGYGSSADAFRITDIEPEGRGAVESMREALADAGIDPSQLDDKGRPPIQYISAHGTSTKENDSTETHAVKRVFGDLVWKIPVSSTKSMTGHLIAAAGAVEAIVCLLTIRDGMLAPTMNLTHPDPACDLDYVANKARPADVDVTLSNSFGFGGQNNTLIISRFSPDRT
ncbi:MAG: beta-ketoacyl-[acyl-carrier-protein] synthase family protein [Phycisphaerales bacterium]|nr:beta-ketoacyl-[acyl-carrier-protein] synthase family protein [Phycisphaerales bacterium]